MEIFPADKQKNNEEQSGNNCTAKRKNNFSNKEDHTNDQYPVKCIGPETSEHPCHPPFIVI